MNGALSLLAALTFAGGAVRRPIPQLDWRWIALLLAGALAVLVWGLFQLLPGLHPFEAPQAAGDTISVNRAASWAALLQAATFVLLFLACIGIGVSKSRARFLLQLILGVSFAIAVYGLVCRFSGFKQVFLLPEIAYPGVLTGTFVNRNTAASYFAIGIAAGTSLLATHLESQLRHLADRLRGRHLVMALFQGAGLYLFALLVIAAAAVDTASRAGTVAAVVAFLGVTLLASYGLRSHLQSRIALALFALGGVIAVVAIAGDQLLLRLDHLGVEDESRLAVFADTLRMIAARPISGFGFGAFADAYPLFHSAAVPSEIVWNRAHNFYLQAAAELGLVAAILVFIMLGAVLLRLFVEVGKRTEPTPLINAALGMSIALAIHSVIDFSVQIQAVALTAAVLLGGATGEAMRLAHARAAMPAPPTTPDHEASVTTTETIYVDHSSIKSPAGE